MMSSVSKVLKDDGARRDAISLHDRSILVEAGAGSGKTAVMAGRIAAMLAKGVAPRSIAAVTFSELAASELLSRVREFVADLSVGTIATELRVALPDGLSQAHRDNLAAASAAMPPPIECHIRITGISGDSARMKASTCAACSGKP